MEVSMSNKKILFFDIDGTLLSEISHSIPESTIIALEKAKENGHLIFINTGRPFSSIDKCIKKLKPDGYVCGCGTYIVYHNKELLSFTLSPKCCIEIRDLIRRTKVEGILEGKDTIYFDTTIKHPALKEIKKRFQNTPDFKISNFDDPNLSFEKFTIWFNKYSDINTFKKYINNDFNYIVRAKDFGEIVPKGYSKATGIQFLLDYFNIDKDNTYVFGDSFNDVAMLEYVKHAIVMGNAEPELFKLAYFVTKTVEEDGIYHALNHLKLI